jgi:hypothetical protein
MISTGTLQLLQPSRENQTFSPKTSLPTANSADWPSSNVHSISGIKKAIGTKTVSEAIAASVSSAK